MKYINTYIYIHIIKYYTSTDSDPEYSKYSLLIVYDFVTYIRLSFKSYQHHLTFATTAFNMNSLTVTNFYILDLVFGS